MFVALWEFEVKRGCEKRFQKVYGPEGDWAKLFPNDTNCQQTQLLRDPEHPAIYFTLDFWASRQAYENFMAKHAAEYKKLDAAGEELTRGRGRLGASRKCQNRVRARLSFRHLPRQLAGLS